MIRERKWLVAVEIAAAIAMIATMDIRSASGSTPAFQTSDCSSYKLPTGATLVQAAASQPDNTIQIFYAVPGGIGGKLVVPFDVLAATCTDPLVRATVISAQEADKRIKVGMCQFVGDVLAGRTQLPPDRERYFDRKFAEEWYREACLGTK